MDRLGFFKNDCLISDKQDDYDRARKDDYNMTLRAMIYDRKATPGER